MRTFPSALAQIHKMKDYEPYLADQREVIIAGTSLKNNSFLLSQFQVNIKDVSLGDILGFIMSVNKNIHILVVEDHAKVRSLLVQALQNFNFNNIHQAVDGEQAWKFLARKKIHIVFSDVVMPRMDGYELLKKIRASEDPHIRNLPVVLVTSKGDKESLIQAAPYNVCGYIVKPFKAKVLLEKIQEIWDRDLIDALFE